MRKAMKVKYKMSGKTALITGGGSGIGRLISKRLAKKGCHVVIWDIRKDMADAVVAEINSDSQNPPARAYKVDLSSRQEVYDTAEKLKQDVGFVEIIINNAGIVTGKTLLEASDAQIERTFDVNVMCHFWIVRSFLADMLQRDQGYIVSIASSAGLAGVPKLVDYCSSKFAAVGFNESLRLELQRLGSNIHTTVVCPYYINTGMFDGVKQSAMFGLMNILKADWVVEQIISGMENKQQVLMLPALVHVAVYCKALLPPSVCDMIMKICGFSNTMDDFKGRQKTV